MNYSAKSGAAGKDLGKPGKNFAKIAASAGKEYGSVAEGKRVAGAVLNNLRHRSLANAHKGGGSSQHPTPKNRPSSV